MDFWESFYAVAVLASATSSAALLAWFLYDVFWRQPRERRGATRRDSRREIVTLQWKRRRALRQLGSRWVLHPNQPPVKWGYKHD